MSIPENFISLRVERHPNGVRSYFLVDLGVKNFELFFLLLKSAYDGFFFFSSVLIIYEQALTRQFGSMSTGIV